MKVLITRLKNGAESLEYFHGKFASSKEARNWRHMAALTVLAAIILSFAQNNTSNETTETTTPGDNAIEAILAASLSLQNDPTGPREISRLRVNETDLPQNTLATLNGKAFTLGGAKGRLLVQITTERNHREAPGFSPEDIAELKTTLAAPEATAVVELTKTNWKLTDNTYPEDTRSRTNPRRTTVVLSDYQAATDTFLCRRNLPGKSVEYGRLPAQDLASTGSALAIASVQWTEDGKTPLNLPEDFHWDKTLIQPGLFAFLALPFEKQPPSGICMASSTYNVLRYLDPNLPLSQEEIFGMLNDGKNGASDRQLRTALKNLGYTTTMIPEGKLRRTGLRKLIQSTLDTDTPLIIATSSHALTLIGYNNATNKFYVWDQRMRGNSPKGMPADSKEVSQGELGRFDFFLIIRKITDRASDKEYDLFAEVGAGYNDLQKHSITNANPTRENMLSYTKRNWPLLARALFANGRSLYVQTGRKEFIKIAPQEIQGDQLQITELPSGKTSQISLDRLTQKIARSNVFFSSQDYPDYENANRRPHASNNTTSLITAKGLPIFSHIQVTRPTAKYLLVMKCMAARAPGYDSKGDKGDIKFLMKHLKIQSEKDALSILGEFYDKNRIAPKSQFLILECLQELGKIPGGVS